MLGTLDVPLLVLAARQDTFTPARCSEAMVDMAPDAELVWFDDGHHTLPIEEPDRIVEEIERFLRDRA